MGFILCVITISNAKLTFSLEASIELAVVWHVIRFVIECR